MYAGANGNKICVMYEVAPYMLKFPPQAKRNKDMSYSNSCFSEYLGCQIYESIGIPVQKTLLGTYTVKGREKIVVACGDFTEPGVILQDFASLKNQMIDSERNGYGTELSDILLTFEEQTVMDPGVLMERFGICLSWTLLSETGTGITETGVFCMTPGRMRWRWPRSTTVVAAFIPKRMSILWHPYWKSPAN